MTGVSARRPDGAVERIGCGRLILACNGFGGNREMVRAHMHEIGEAIAAVDPDPEGRHTDTVVDLVEAYIAFITGASSLASISSAAFASL